jgi:ankyrin repeat protein
VLCRQLKDNTRGSRKSALEKSRYFLALGICHIQGFYAAWDKCDASRSTLDTVHNGFNCICNAAKLGNPSAQAIISRLCDRLPPNEADLMRQTLPVATWLATAMHHGHVRAAWELKSRYPEQYSEALAISAAGRLHALAALASPGTATLTGAMLDPFGHLTPALKSVLTNPRITKLQQSAYLGSLEICQAIISESGVEEIGRQDDDGYTALHYAARGGCPKVVEYLLAEADPNARSKHGRTPLHMAVLSTAAEDVGSILLCHGAKPNVFSTSHTLDGLAACRDYYLSGYGTPLHLAVLVGDVKVASLLLEAGADPNSKEGGGLSPLESAVRLHSVKMVEILMPFAVNGPGALPSEHDLYPRLAGSFVSPLLRILYWDGGLDGVSFVSDAVRCIESHGISLDDRGILGAALDANNASLADVFLRKLGFGTPKADSITPFRYRVENYDDNFHHPLDLPLWPDLHAIFSMVLQSCGPDTLKTVLKYVQKPLPSHGASGRHLLHVVGSRQFASLDDTCGLFDAVIAAGVTVIGSTIRDGEHGVLQAAATSNNHHAVEALLRHRPPLQDVEDATRTFLRKGSYSRAALEMIDLIFEHRPEVLTVPLPSRVDPISAHGVADNNAIAADTNYLRVLCQTREFGRDDDIHRTILNAIFDKTRGQEGGIAALWERVHEMGVGLLGEQTPLHCAARNGDAVAVKALLSLEGVDVNATSRDPVLADLELDLPDLGDLSLTDTNPAPPSTGLMMRGLGRGPTPLDMALKRSWELSLFLWPEPTRQALLDLRRIGGTRKEEADYNKRTDEVVKLLRDAGAKTGAELFDIPASVVQAGASFHTTVTDRYKKQNEIRAPSDTHERIFRFFGLACSLPSQQLTLNRYPGLAGGPHASHPRFSLLHRDVVDGFAAEEVLRGGLAAAKTEYDGWAGRNDVVRGALDAIQEVEGGCDSVALSAGLMYCFCEVLRTLELISEVLSATVDEKRKE